MSIAEVVEVFNHNEAARFNNQRKVTGLRRSHPVHVATAVVVPTLLAGAAGHQCGQGTGAGC